MPEKRNFSSERFVYLGIIILVIVIAVLTVKHFAGDKDNGQLPAPSAEIKKESMTVVKSAEGNAIVVVPRATRSSSGKIYVRQAENPSIDSDSRISSIYEFGPEGTSFDKPVEVRIRYYDAGLKSCPSSLFFRHYDKNGALKGVIPHKSIYCGVNFASFEISSFSQGYVAEDDGTEKIQTGRGNCEDWDRGGDGACKGIPRIDSISPISVGRGQSFTIKGKYLTRTVQFIDINNNRYSFNWANGITMNNARTEVIMQLPNELAAGKYRVRTWTSRTLVSNEVEITIEGQATGSPGSGGGTVPGPGSGQPATPAGSLWSPKQTDNGWFPQLSPDGRYITYGFGENWVADLQTGEERSLTITKGQSFYGLWIMPDTYTFSNIYSDSEADRYEVKAGEWIAKKTNDDPRLVAGNIMVAADGHWASWLAGQNRIAYDNSVLATGHGVAIGEGGWLLHSDPEHTAMYVWHNKQEAATYAPQIPLHGWAINRGYILYGGYGLVHGINPQGQDIDLTVAPWKWEGIGGVVFVNNQPWVYTSAWDDTQNKGYVLIRPWGEKEGIAVEGEAAGLHVVYANNEFVIAMNSDRGQLRVVKVPANVQRVDLSNPNSYNTGGNNVCNPTPETPLAYPSCVEEIDAYAKCAREKDDVCIFAECRDVLWMTRNTNAALGCSQDFTYHGIPAATWRGWVENEAKAVLDACKDVCHPGVDCERQPDSVDKDKLLQALENYWKNCIQRGGISCVCTPNEGVCAQFAKFIGRQSGSASGNNCNPSPTNPTPIPNTPTTQNPTGAIDATPGWLGDLAFDSKNNNWLVVSHNAKSIQGRIIKNDGNYVTNSFQISPESSTETWSPLAAYSADTNKFLVIWVDYSNGIWDAYGRFVSPDGTMGNEFRLNLNSPVLNAGGDRTSAIKYDSKNKKFVFVWENRGSDHHSAILTTVDLDGKRGSLTELLDDENGGINGPSIAVNEDKNEYCAVYDLRNSGKWSVRKIDASTLAVGPKSIVDFTTTNIEITYNSKDKKYLVIYDAGYNIGVMGRFLNSCDANDVSKELLVLKKQGYSSVASNPKSNTYAMIGQNGQDAGNGYAVLDSTGNILNSGNLFTEGARNGQFLPVIRANTNDGTFAATSSKDYEMTGFVANIGYKITDNSNNQPSTPQCGNSIKEGNEQCDEGSNNGACPKTCSAICMTNNCANARSVTLSVNSTSGMVPHVANFTAVYRNFPSCENDYLWYFGDASLGVSGSQCSGTAQILPSQTTNMIYQYQTAGNYNAKLVVNGVESNQLTITVNTACSGITCNNPPAPQCINGNTLRTFTQGICSDGQCAYNNYNDANCAAQGKICQNGQCVQQCAPNAQKKCDGDAIYWYDSCNNKGSIYYDCSQNIFRKKCNNAQCCLAGGLFCYTPPASCQDACTPGEKRCKNDNSGYEECADSDNNGCFSWENHPCQNGCANGNCNTQNNARAAKFGILYSTGHCPARNPPLDISEILAGRQQWGPVPAYHWWDEPQDGYYCLSTDESVLRDHAAKFKDAGIDFIVFTASEHPYADSRSDRPQELLLKPLEKILQVWSTIPNAPKVVPWFPLSGDSNIDSAILPILERYPDMRFIYLGKPLLLVNAIEESRASALSPRYTIRKMWGLEDSGNSWSFLSKCAPGFKQSQGNQPCNQRISTLNGQPEQISVTAAYQETGMSDKRTAVPKFNGKTFVKQFQTVFDYPSVPVVIITGWNEWVVQRGCYDANGIPVGENRLCVVDAFPDGSKLFTDEYDIEYSKDIEPAKNEKGDFYYQLMKSCIQKFRNGESSCDTNVQFTPYKTESCANDINCAANNGKCENSNCVCRNNDNSCGSYPNCANCASQGKICGNGGCVVRQCTNTDGRKFNPGDMALCGNCGTKTCQNDGTFGPCSEGAC